MKQSLFVGNPLSYVWACECIAQPASSQVSCEFCVVSASERAMFELEHGDGVGTHFAHIAVKGDTHWLRQCCGSPACLMRLLGIRYDEESSL